MNSIASILLLLISAPAGNCLVPTAFQASKHDQQTSITAIQQQQSGDISTTSSRRNFFSTAAALILPTAAATIISSPAPAAAEDGIPMITTNEFSLILKDSAQAVSVVEFSGPKSETVTVKLVDGTAFGINDVVESSVDPRSPLKIAALCRENQVKTKFLALEAALKNAPKRKVLYTNERVLEAAQKEREKAARIQQDEEARLAELYRMQEEEAAKMAAKQ